MIIKKNYIFLLFLLIIFQAFPVHSETMSVCKAVASELKKSLPIKKDNLTTIRDVGCLQSKPKNLLIYILEVDALLSAVKMIDFNKELKPINLRIFCSDPKIRPVLDAYDIDHRYYTIKGDFAGSFLLSSKECSVK